MPFSGFLEVSIVLEPCAELNASLGGFEIGATSTSVSASFNRLSIR
jgi:hypothetical protein